MRAHERGACEQTEIHGEEIVTEARQCHFARLHRAARHLVALEDADLPALLGQMNSTGQTIMAAPHDDGIIVHGHPLEDILAYAYNLSMRFPCKGQLRHILLAIACIAHRIMRE